MLILCPKMFLGAATQEVVDGKREVGVDALEEVMMHVGAEL